MPKPSANQGAAKVDRTHSPHERGGHFRARECNGAPCHLQGLPAPWIVTALCLLVVLVGSASAVRLSPQADRDFEKGLSAYQEEDLSAARKHFTTIVDAPENQRTSAALLMLTRTLLRAEQFRAGLDAAKRLEREFPRSRYSSDVQLLIGDCYLGLQRRYEAAVYYARLLDNESAAVELRASAAERLVVVFRNHLISRDAQGRIEQQVTDGLLEEALLFGEGRWFVRLGWGPQGREQLGEYLRTYKEGTFAHLARNRLAALGGITVPAPADMEPPASSPDSPWRTSPSRPGVPRIGVLLPLTGQSESDAATASVGREILDGIRYANEAAGEPFDLVVEDTGARFVDFEGEILPVRQSEGSRLIRVHNGARRLVEEGVEAIIGPIYSTSCVVAAAVAEAAGVPLLAPLAQQSGLDSLGSHVFQLNPIAEVQGQALAEYATLVLGLETLAILSPLSDYGAAFERSFTRAATLNGGRIVMSDQYFPQETTDFHRQFESLRQVGFELQPALERIDSLATLDSLAVSLLDTTLEGEWTFIEVVEGVVDEEPPDSSEVFLQTIDGVAVIVEHFDDAKTIAPQLHFHRLETQMLGNDVWYDPESIHAMGATERGHLAGAIFVARRQGGVAEQEFLNDYRSQRQRDPGYAADGYDAAQMLIDGWRAGHGSRRQLREWLQQVREYHGASGRVAFTDDRRVNSALQLLRIGADGSAGGLDENELPEIATAGPAADLPAADLPEDDAPWESMPLEEDVESSY